MVSGRHSKRPENGSANTVRPGTNPSLLRIEIPFPVLCGFPVEKLSPWRFLMIGQAKSNSHAKERSCDVGVAAFAAPRFGALGRMWRRKDACSFWFSFSPTQPEMPAAIPAGVFHLVLVRRHKSSPKWLPKKIPQEKSWVTPIR